MRRVAITGIGVVAPGGLEAGAFRETLTAGRSAIGPSDELAGLRFRQRAAVEGFDPERHFEPKALLLLDRFAQFGLVAARQAMSDAAIAWTPALRDAAAIVTGSCLGGTLTEDAGYQDLYLHKKPRFNPMTIPRAMENAPASHIAMEFGLRGPAYTVSTACASSAHAIGQAFWMVRSGMAPVAIAGGAEAPFSPGVLKAWEALRVVSPDTCRPFSLNRQGLILGEGSAMVVLEPWETARARGATIYAEVAGFGMTADAHHITAPLAEGAARAMVHAMADAGISAEAVGYINAHGTGTQANDAAETRAIRMAMGGAAERVAVSSTKSMHGHTLGAAGALEAVATALALRHGVLPPTVNYTEPDPECDLDVIPNTGRARGVEYAMSNSFAFGGLNAVLVLRAV